MTHPLEALGLGRDADERAVKRAYAQRLKATRPDEDPVGFQKLHETYQSALSFLRWQADNPGETWCEDDLDDDEPAELADEAVPESCPEPAGMPQSEFEALIGNPRFTPPRPEPKPEAPPLPPPQFERVRDEPEPFRLDIRDFLKRLFGEADADLDADRLRAWLARETAEWPLVVKPRVAHDVIAYMFNEAPDLTPAQLEAVVEHFGLDDVQTGVDPIGLEELRARAAQQLRQRKAKFSHLFRPENRGEFARYMSMPEQGGGQPQFLTRIALFLLTNRRAYEWAFWLRPVPFVNRLMMAFLRDIDHGRFDAFDWLVDRTALDFWQWAEMRREANRGFRWLVAIVCLLGALAYVTKDAPNRRGETQTKRPGRTVFQAEDRRLQQRFAERIRLANEMENAKGLAEYEAMLAELPKPPWTPAWEEIAALLHYNRAVIQAEGGKGSEAKAGYGNVDTLFARSQNWPVQLITAKALVNLGHLLASEKAFRESLLPYQQVVARYGANRVDQFDLQVAMALKGRADSFTAMDEPEEARHALDDLLRRFGDKTEGDLGELVRKARAQREALDPGSGASAPTLVPGETSRP